MTVAEENMSLIDFNDVKKENRPERVHAALSGRDLRRRLTSLESEPERELNQAGFISLRINHSEIRLIGLTASSSRRPKLRFVEQVEHFCPELKP